MFTSFSLLIPPPPRSTLFPYTTLFRSEDELEGLADKVNSARVALETFRRNHDISSTEREENEAAARLRGLNDSLNKASEEEVRSEEHTSELQSRLHLVCRLLLEKKNKM